MACHTQLPPASTRCRVPHRSSADGEIESEALTRRAFLLRSALAALLATSPGLLPAKGREALIRRAIPSSGESLPVIGLGGSATFRSAADEGAVGALTDVIDTLVTGGGTFFDTAAIYGASEQVAGAIARSLGVEDELFWAIKVYVKPGSVPSTMKAAAARAQIDRSFERIGKQRLDLIQLHDITSLREERCILDELKRLKDSGRIRYIGATTIRKEHYPDLEQAMREELVDFIGIDYAVDNRSVADRILPLAMDLGIAVLAYRPFGISRLWRRVAGLALPQWAEELGAESWAQFFIKYVAAHPAVTVVTPGTSKPRNMLDNLGAGVGAVPDRQTSRRMERFVDALPDAPA